MPVTHVHTLRTTVRPSHIQYSTDGVFLAVPHGRCDVAVWSLQDITCKPLILEGHRKSVTAIALSHGGHPSLLCSAAEDYIIIWNIQRIRAAFETGQPSRGQVIGQTLGHVNHVSFSYDDLKVAVCAEREIYILDSRQQKQEAILEGHTSIVNCAEFCPHYTSTVVTAGDDRTFKVWNISNCTLLYQSTIISSSPFISITMNPMHESFVLGSADGQIRIYDLTDGNDFRCLHHLNVDNLLQKFKETSEKLKCSPRDNKGPVTISSRPSWHRLNSSQGNQDQDEDYMESESEIGSSVLGMLYMYSHETQQTRTPTPSKLSFLRQDSSIVNDLLQEAPMLVIGTTGALIQLNARTLEPCAINMFSDPISSVSMMEASDVCISSAGNIVLAHCGPNTSWCIVGGIFQNEIHILQISHPNQQEITSFKSLLTNTSPSKQEEIPVRVGDIGPEGDEGAEGIEGQISVLSCGALCPNSPLKAELVLKAKEKKPAAKGAPKQQPGTVGKKGSIVDNQPITFKNSVRSSGYSETSPTRKMFQPMISANKGRTTPKPKVASTKTIVKEYPLQCGAPTLMKTKIEVAERATSISAVQFSGDGQYLAAALGNTSAQVFKMPLSGGKGCAFAGHQGVLSRASWSNDSKLVITSSDDRSAAIWSMGLSDPVMNVSCMNNNFGTDKEGGLKPDKENPLFSKPVRYGQFYYMDKFFLLTCGNSFHLYKYHLDTTKSDIKRYLSNNRYKLVKSFQMTQSQQLTAFSAINSFYSYIALAAGSDKSIEVFDLNVAQSVRIIPDAHVRSIHVITQNEGSSYVTQPSSAYDLFVTAASSDCIKLWDLRTSRCVRRYEGHVNRTLPCGVAISPCSKFIATGSEDRSAYIFDIRSGTYLHKLTGHTDTVSDVAFHPLYPQMVTATLDGKLRLFAEG